MAPRKDDILKVNFYPGFEDPRVKTFDLETGTLVERLPHSEQVISTQVEVGAVNHLTSQYESGIRSTELVAFPNTYVTKVISKEDPHYERMRGILVFSDNWHPQVK